MTYRALPGAAVHYRTVTVDGVDIFYREAGTRGAPTILLLHGFPTSSHMFRNLIPMLADRFHVVAPDYPGFGYSATPSVDQFNYTFDHLTDVMQAFTETIELDRYALYAHDFGGPVGFRLATRRPERVTALIVQNANAYEEGLSDIARELLIGIWHEHTVERERKVRSLFELPATKWQYYQGVETPTLVSPDAWQHAQWGMERPGNKDIQFVLHVNYGSNIDEYPKWQQYFRDRQPPTLVVWGRGDPVFLPAGASAFTDDLKNIEVHLLNTGHFALETHAEEIAERIRRFLPAP